ncbi:MAG: adenylyl-sulfate kinase [Actinomycetota bacterium]|nr:adenylyl-sulfate kinase [Actinomycetota bacterium]
MNPPLAPGPRLLRLATAGSIDDGKSTLIGRLLFDSKQILADQLAAVERTSRLLGREEPDLSLLTDGLRAEREQGITIDVAYRYFATPRRAFILADTPGHPQYTRNMVTGVSTADLALILVDARHGITDQTRRHAFIASLMRVPHFVVCVNKMDLVDYDERAFEALCAEFRAFVAALDVADLTFIPVSALRGDNVVEASEKMPWFDGRPLLSHLEHLEVATDRKLVDARFPVQWVIRPRSDAEASERRYAGQVAGGVLRPHDEIVVLPSGHRTRIAAIETYDGALSEAVPSMSVTLRLEDRLDVSRGDMLCRTGSEPQAAREIDAILCWMGDSPLVLGGRYVLKHTTRSVAARVHGLEHRVDVSTLTPDRAAKTLELNDIGRVRLRTATPVMADPYAQNRSTGSFILIDGRTNETVAAGLVMATAFPTRAPTMTAANVVWQRGAVTRERRWQLLGQRGGTVWLTGLPGAGKTTIAMALEERLAEADSSAYVLDGDNLRHGLNADLGFGAAARAENVRRTAEVARLIADTGTLAIVSLISPYADDRARARAIHERAGLDFLEIFVDTPAAECERRDPKGLWARARRGEIREFTGVDSPYEPPPDPQFRLQTVDIPLTDELERLIELLTERGLVRPA